MFKKFLSKIKLLQADLNHKRQTKEILRKTALECMQNNIRDKAIIYCTKLHASSDILALPPTHLVDTALFDLIRSEKDVIKYHKRFPYKELIERWI